MAFAPSMSSSFSAQFFSPLSRKRAGLGFNKPCSLILSYPSHTSAVSLSRSPRRQLGLAVCGAKNKKKAKKKQIIHESPDGEDEDLDDDAFESLFKQLEEDLKNDENLSFDDDDLEISEEDFTRLESELKEALGVDDDIEIFGETKDSEQGEDDDDTADQVDDKDDDDDDDEDGETPVELKRWQLRRLASALKAGRRKTSVSLCWDLCLVGLESETAQWLEYTTPYGPCNGNAGQWAISTWIPSLISAKREFSWLVFN
ncbi:hypothetical protein CRG98_032453 [Punica granatum]|uniref:Uncharacterized protein n=1 Tax=Punica granatum TaxID=22663 RepID=A0A2I0IT17_PUNGR|nr:hypothetical protein CRG98_032453 [Punica granatum]